ncbi:hypothetical protein [Comamonas terrae]|uniref:Uncharacterized protein n=1 Tax=Comamonas terrae TaxID=673548 RepID=A0ABW5UQF1_9BURK|nr:hypothetical protein [Comamonas terrae]
MEKTVNVLKTEAEISKLMAETVKLNAEAAKMIRERAWYPAIAMATALGAGAAIAKLLLA